MLLAPLLFAAGETRPEGVAPQPMRLWASAFRGHRVDWRMLGGSARDGGWVTCLEGAELGVTTSNSSPFLPSKIAF